MRPLQVALLLVGVAVLAAGSAVAGRLWLPELQLRTADVAPSAQRAVTTATPTPNYKVAIQAIRTRLNASDAAVIGSLGRIKSEVDYVEAGAHPRVVAERLGHADPGLTLRVYAHATATMQGEATAAMDRVLGA